MPRKLRRPTRRGRKLRPWIKRARKRQKGGIFFSLAAISAAIAAAVSAAAPAIATGALGAAASYGTSKLLKKVGGRRRYRRCK